MEDINKMILYYLLVNIGLPAVISPAHIDCFCVKLLFAVPKLPTINSFIPLLKIDSVADETMRRAAFYMGRTYTTRHLNAVRSPLMTGFISARGISMTQACFAINPMLTMNGAVASTADGVLLECPTACEIVDGVLTSTPLTQVPTGLQTWISLCGVRTTIRNMPVMLSEEWLAYSPSDAPSSMAASPVITADCRI